ncbi:DUF4190 domain-containing protein [Micromonospora olivasterospora]|uniref:Uncharacterized protein DUF4190 n=1 Tax=Micromonospora olivasterospora TaxID=1880 RepID=A0A562IB12_MICOL|nr:DUF4190 domain-containing protein [Micromonospora olivasterospora]TWH68219.1 uncharacterized protein DUF4190 [Micromonospora olivasterospora]
MSHPAQEPDQPPSPYEPPGGGGPGAGWHGPPGPPIGYEPPTGYGQPGPYPPPGPGRGTNVLAVLSLVFAFVFAPAGIVLGHVAKRQIQRTGEEGDQLATWGLILSYVFTVLGVLACCGWIAFAIWAGSDGGTYR